MNKARITLKHAVTLGPHRVSPGAYPYVNPPIECSYEDCLGAMLPKFYYPADPAELEIRSPYGRPAGTKREPSYQVPADAIESVEVEEEVVRRWEKILEDREVARVVEDEKRDVIVLCRCMHRRDDHGRDDSWPCFRCVCTEFEPDFFGNEEDVCRRCGVESEAHSPGPCTYEDADIVQAVRDDPFSQEALVLVDEHRREKPLTLAEAVEKIKADDTVSFHAVTNGTSATLDAIAAAELQEAYAKGSR